MQGHIKTLEAQLDDQWKLGGLMLVIGKEARRMYNGITHHDEPGSLISVQVRCQPSAPTSRFIGFFL
jgi:hypothetical protein